MKAHLWKPLSSNACLAASTDIMTVKMPAHVLNEWLFLALLLGGILFIGFFNLAIYFGRNQLKIYFYFGMLCVFYFLWYVSSRVVPFDVFPLYRFSEHQRAILSVISSNRLTLYFVLYLLSILDIRKPFYEKYLKIGANLFLILCFFMAFSIPFSQWMIHYRVMAIFTVIALLVIIFEVIKSVSIFRKDTRLIHILTYLMVCVIAVINLFNVPFVDSTLLLAFVILIPQSLIMAFRYNRALASVEEANQTLEKTVAARTAELVQKEEETTQLILSISHDLRTPISVVNGYMELLQGDPAVEAINQQFVASSLVRLSQMEKLTLDLFTLAQLSDKSYTFQFETFPIAEEIQRILALYTQQAEQQGILLHMHAEPSQCVADKLRVMQVLDNLMINALAYAKSSIHITVMASENEVIVTVTDDGPGIPLADLPYVFDRFYGKRKAGSGLGLSNVKALVHRMQGQVNVESIPHVRTSFIFTLPLSSSSEPTEP